ncbi:MAG: PAS domain S-box protein [Candidatus Omnitrophica bacterium]|nr:PAS domain S-box protein [Candidatus Omnitrophota bacterium]
MIESPVFGMLIVDTEGCIRFLNGTIQSLFGYSQEEIMGETIEKLLPERVRGDHSDFRSDYFKDPEIRAMGEGRDLWALRKDGSTFPVEVGLNPIEIDGERFAVATIVDITTRKTTEETFATVIQSSLFAVLIVDQEGCIRFANETVRELFGYSVEDLKGEKVEILLPDRIRSAHPGHREDYFSKPEVRAMGEGRDLNAKRKDGSEFPVEIGLNPVEVNGSRFAIATIIDITKRKAAEAAHRHSERLLKTTQQLSGIGGWEFNIETGNIYWTDQVKKIHEVSLDYQPTLESALDFFHPESGEILREAFDKAVKKGTPYDLELGFRTAKGRDLIVRTHGEVEMDGDRPVRVFGTFLDVTEEKKEEARKKRMDEQIQHAQKMESLGVLAGGIAHDFNNMLLAILGNAELAMEDLSPSAPCRQNIQDVIATTTRAADLCRQMLAYSGRGRFLVQPLNLSELIEESLHLIEVSIAKRALLKLKLSNNLPLVEADASQVRQVIMNLITNASDAIGDQSGIITLITGAMECDRDYLSESYLDRDLKPGNYVYCEVADTGCGMDSETKNKVFDPFFSTKFTGRGLGMAAVLGILRGHNGAIKIYSEPGHGTTVKALFPVSEAAEPTDQRMMGQMDGWTGSGKVLVVDDEDTVRILGKRILEKAGFEVLLASDGCEALEIYRRDGDNISLVLLDMTMPQMDGEEAFREIRKIRNDARVILSSGYNEQDATSNFAGKGLSGFIQKPYRPIDLVKKVREIL